MGNPERRSVASRDERREMAQWHGPLPPDGFVRNNIGCAVVRKTKPEQFQLSKQTLDRAKEITV